LKGGLLPAEFRTKNRTQWTNRRGKRKDFPPRRGIEKEKGNGSRGGQKKVFSQKTRQREEKRAKRPEKVLRNQREGGPDGGKKGKA